MIISFVIKLFFSKIVSIYKNKIFSDLVSVFENKTFIFLISALSLRPQIQPWNENQVYFSLYICRYI